MNFHVVTYMHIFPFEWLALGSLANVEFLWRKHVWWRLKVALVLGNLTTILMCSKESSTTYENQKLTLMVTRLFGCWTLCEGNARESGGDISMRWHYSSTCKWDKTPVVLGITKLVDTPLARSATFTLWISTLIRHPKGEVSYPTRQGKLYLCCQHCVLNTNNFLRTFVFSTLARDCLLFCEGHNLHDIWWESDSRVFGDMFLWWLGFSADKH